MAIIYALIGKTNVGKTRSAEFLDLKLGIKHIHPARCMKSHYEELLCKPEGWLDSQEGKAYIPEGTNYTMQEIMVEEYHMKQKYFPTYSAHYLNKILPPLLSSGHDLCVVSLRNLAEPQALIKVAEEGKHLLVLIKLSSFRERAETSDEHIPTIISILEEAAQLSYSIENNGELEDLYNQLHSIVSVAINYDWTLHRSVEEKIGSY